MLIADLRKPLVSAAAVAALSLSLAGAAQDLSGADQNHLSFHLAGSLPLDLDFKQRLLAMRSESERIQSVTTYLEKILPKLRRVARTREKAGGNGHVH